MQTLTKLRQYLPTLIMLKHLPSAALGPCHGTVYPCSATVQWILISEEWEEFMAPQ